MNTKNRLLFLILIGCFTIQRAMGQRMAVGAKPNIIFIIADDLGYGDVGFTGQQKIKTPQIDALAASGLRFNQFYAGTSVCAPSRASLLTGLHTGHTQVRGNRGMQPEGQTPLAENTSTIGTLLQEAGYYTAAFGKWGLGGPGSSGIPEKQGFNEFYGYNCQSLAHNYYPDHIWQNSTRIEWPGNLRTDSLYSADNIQQKALEFIATPRDQPYFLFLPYTLPHGDLDVPKDEVYKQYVKLFNEPAVAKPIKPKTGDRYEPYPHAAFAAMVARLDKYVGEIRKQVAASGQENNTLIIFTSDNGPHREDGGDPEFFNSSGPFRGIKRDLYEGGIRVPMIAYWKNKITPGKTEQTGAFWDFYATFQDLTAMPVMAETDGITLVPTLLKKGKQPQHPFYYWEFHENKGRQAVRMGNWKGVVYEASTEKPLEMELYNLASDPGESNNVAIKNPKIVAEIKAIMLREHIREKAWPFLISEIAEK